MTGKNISKRLLYLIVCVAAGVALCAPLLYIWFFITSTILGYGDSGPDWVRTTIDFIEIITITGSAIGSQVFFQYGFKKDHYKYFPVKDVNSFTSKYLFHLLSTLVGLLLGLFLGLYVFPNLFRAIIDILDYGKKTTASVFGMFVFASIVIDVFCIYYSNKWTRNYLNKK